MKKLAVLAVAIGILVAVSLYVWWHGAPVILSSDPYTSLYNCAETIFHTNPFPAAPLEERVLATDLFFVLDEYTNDIYVYTPSYAGQSKLPADETVNFRIPHSSALGIGNGYFYATAHDYPYDNHHDTRINLPPRFIPGVAQNIPDFSQVPEHGGVTLLPSNYEPTTEPFVPLLIEKSIWSSDMKTSAATTTLSKLVQSRLPDLYRTSHMGCPGFGCSYSPLRADATFHRTMTICQNAANLNNDMGLKSALAATPTR